MKNINKKDVAGTKQCSRFVSYRDGRIRLVRMSDLLPESVSGCCGTSSRVGEEDPEKYNNSMRGEALEAKWIAWGHEIIDSAAWPVWDEYVKAHVGEEGCEKDFFICAQLISILDLDICPEDVVKILFLYADCSESLTETLAVGDIADVICACSKQGQAFSKTIANLVAEAQARLQEKNN